MQRMLPMKMLLHFPEARLKREAFISYLRALLAYCRRSMPPPPNLPYHYSNASP